MFVRLVCTARRLEKRRKELLAEKRLALEEYEAKNLTLRQKCTRLYIKLTTLIRRCCLPKHSYPFRLCFNLRHKGTCENFCVKSVAGFLGGFCLTYIFFMFFVLQLNFKLSTATIMCSIFGSILTIGLAFSFNVRCIVFLVLPQFFSKKGRQALLAYAYILAITGPAKNTLNNMSILGESLACGQEELKAAVKQIIEVIKKPFYAIKDAIKQVVKTVKDIVAKIKEILLSIKRIIMTLVKIIKSAFEFQSQVMNVCNKEFGTPYERCRKVFEEAVIDCNAKLGPLFNWLCNITYLVKTVCVFAKVLDFLCIIVDFIKDTISAIVTKVKQFVRHIRTMFYVRIKFSHSYHFETNSSKSMSEITTGIVTEIKQRSSGLIKIFDFMSSAASLFFIFMVVKVIYYRQKFLTNEMFDNKFITNDFRQIDLRRAGLGLETVLPLNHRERKLYITTSSMRLVKKEKSRLSEAAMILMMSTLKLSTHMATDYSLYWIMTLIRQYGRFQSNVNASNVPNVYIKGEGFLYELLTGIVKAFQPIGLNLEIDTIPCLPDPIPPDFDRYIQIASLLVLCWFLAIFEPYGLRFRHSVMCYYHPQRARERAIWLYNHILRSRSSFLKFARRQLRRKVMSDKSISEVSLLEFLRARILRAFPYLGLLFEKDHKSYCLLCGEVNRENDNKVFIKCQTPNCPGLFCEQCFNDLQNLCTVCLDPISYGDLSDISEEQDSSATETDGSKPKKKVRKRKKSLRRHRKKEDDGDESTDNDDDDNDDQKQLLLKSKSQIDDSDYISHESDLEIDDDSSELSYEYQKQKDITQKSTDVTSPKFSDLEMQRIPEEASMQDFTNDEVLKYLMRKNMYNEEECDSSSSNITDLQPDSLGHLNDNERLIKPPNSKVSSVQHSSHLLTSRSTSNTNEDYSDASSPKKPSKRRLSKRKTNSKISLESIPLERLSDSSKVSRYHSTQIMPSSSSETSFITTPSALNIFGDSKKEEIENVPKFKQSQGNENANVTNLFEPIATNPLTTSGSPQASPSTENSQAYHIKLPTSQYYNYYHVHPCIPELNLNFLNKEDNESPKTTTTACNCHQSTGATSSSKTSCNCRLFKDAVKFKVIDELNEEKSRIFVKDSSSTSSLISSLYWQHLPSCSHQFQVREAEEVTSALPERIGSSMQTESVRVCSLDVSTSYADVNTDRNVDATSDSSISYNNNPSRELLIAPRVSNSREKEKMYRDRVKNYYKKVKIEFEPGSGSSTVRSSRNPIKSLWARFKFPRKRKLP